MVNVEERMGEFKQALRRYMHLLRGGRVDVETAVKIEQAELKLIKDLSESERVACAEAGDLQSLLAILLDSGWLRKAMNQVAAELDAPAEVNPSEALESFLTGRLEDPASRIALIVVQAVARCLADMKVERGEVAEVVSSVCPLCGAESRTMVAGREGYYMVCPFCTYKWIVSRSSIRCPYCGNDNPISLGVFSDRARRLGLVVCQECGNTWRLIIDKSIRAPRILLPVISLGAEAFRRFIREDMVKEPGGQGGADAVVEGGGEEAEG